MLRRPMLEHSLRRLRAATYGPRHRGVLTQTRENESLDHERAERHGGSPRVSFLAWGPVAGRSAEIAAALGGESRCFYDGGIVRTWLVPARWAVSAARTVSYLARRRPRAVIATNPPVFPGLIAYAYGKLVGAPVVLDSHQDAFDPRGRQRHFLPLHRWLTPRVAATLVPRDSLLAEVAAWKGRGVVVHEAPPPWKVRPAAPTGERPRVLFVGSFSPDEPLPVVLEAARLVPELDVAVTGDLRKCPPELHALAPANVRFTGFLRGDDYVAAVEAADVVLVLTTDPDIAAPRAAFEAVYAQRPLVLTAGDGLRELFPTAVGVEATAADVARGLREAVARRTELAVAARAARERQETRWSEQRAAIEAAITGARAPA
jgi:glycosyltransferase involved in cell wall biosynthesis